MVENDMEKWEQEDGVIFLRNIGIKQGDRVVDFGCRIGHYTIPAAKLVGSSGCVYAIDKEQEVLDTLKQRAMESDLKNIEVINTAGDVSVGLADDIVDAVLLYDVLHYFESHKRQKLYMEMWRILKNNGLLSVYPKHTIEDSPMDIFKDMSVDDIRKEIEACKFTFERKYCDTISHNGSLSYGCVLNFRKM